MKEEEIRLIERTVMNRKRYIRRFCSRMRSAWYVRKCKNTVSVVSEAIIQKDYRRMDEDACIAWLSKNCLWLELCRRVCGVEFTKRFVWESNAPEVGKAYLVWTTSWGGALYDLSSIFEETPRRFELVHCISSMEGSGAAETLLMLGISGYGLEWDVVCQLVHLKRIDVIRYWLETSRSEFKEACPPDEFADFIITCTRCDVEMLQLVHTHFPGAVETACRRMVARLEAEGGNYVPIISILDI